MRRRRRVLSLEKAVEVELYLIKWRDISYTHCSWETEADLASIEGIHIRQKMQVRFHVYHWLFIFIIIIID